uniref:Uncharacterized protein n=1 Tax=Mus spicilegus TaxID=10103 RepID=A0A8C6G5B4_MUSSI
FRDRVSLCSPGCPGTHSVDQAGLKLRDSPVFASQVKAFSLLASRSLWDLCWPFGRFSVLGLQRAALPWGRSESRPEERPAGDKDCRHAFAFASLQIPEHSDFPRLPEATDLIGGSRKLLSFGNGALA